MTSPAPYMGADPPVSRIISVTIGADVKFTLRRRNTDGELVPWNAAVYVMIRQRDAQPLRVDATVTGSDAVIRIESTTADQVTNSTTWQAIMSTPGSPSFENPIAVGKFKRHDA